ncbi:hypothetical protein LJ737_04120 [Hymenobacter sp. 15J16-1T3B]|uniref:hypothetical protein n=1 Tax=Hymenobacter sp. 15J16-1T3B TaxID=2886941 RepID=UPI001D1236E9|nr:hypothetical protein [Hymenobacter sp. 15J16-1T3B]MCC3156409.1 hypothetical protein [Hymenobacter sp. 15J16-1T3B]
MHYLFRRRGLLGAALGLGLLAGCGSSGTSVEPAIPSAVVNDLINLSNQDAAPLLLNRGFIYRPGGVRGIIVVRQSAQQYLAFERNCPYQPYDACARVSMDRSGFFLVDSCCTSRFDPSNGLVTSGPARRPLRQYTTSVNGNLLYITN